MNKFLGWLVLFFLLLTSIPVLLFTGWIVPAKVLGVITVLLLSFSVRFWLYKTKKEFDPQERIRLNLNDRFWMKREFSFYNQMSSADKKIFEDRVGVLLSKIPICDSSGELIKDRVLALRVAANVVINCWDVGQYMSIMPSAVILESEIWDEQMMSLKSQEGVIVLSMDSFCIK